MRNTARLLEGRVALVTGAGAGIGKAIAEACAAHGASVVVAELKPDLADATVEGITAAGGRALAAPTDVRDGAQIARAVAAAREAYGGLDVLVNNVGGTFQRPFLEIEEKGWDALIRVNLKSVFHGTRAAAPLLIERGGGSVINVASFVAILGAATSQISYSASKGAVLSMSRELGVQFARQGVRVNALCPGPVETPLLLNIFGDDPAALERRRIHWPMGRLAKPREIVEAALFLASDESSYVNGATFVVDGGLTAAYVTPE
jgi:NAD(P)-dependent dehydrogenase (short-subunit alcohol dehydrogenase family)